MFWDQAAAVYDIFVELINRKCHKELRRAVADCVSADDLVLECACGTGMLTVPVAAKCRELTATDASAEMLRRTAGKCEAYPNVRFQLADITCLPFSDGAFDKVLAANVLHLLREPETALAELARVCRPGGTLILPTYINRQENGRDSAFSRIIGKAGANFQTQFSLADYRAFFADAGYEDVGLRLIEGRVPCALALVQVRK